MLSGPLRSICGLLALLAVTTGAFAQTIDVNPTSKQEVMDKVTEYLTQHAYVPGIDFSKWPDFLQAERPKIDTAANDDEFTRDMNEAFAKFGASHIYLTSPRSTDIRRSASQVGIGVSQVAVPDGIEIVRLVPGAPAEEAGLVPGDIIIKVNGQKVDGIKGIPGEVGTQVTLTVRHADKTEKDYTLTRRKFSTVRPEELTEIDKETAKLTVYTFDFTYDRDNVETLMRRARHYPNLIVDLRSNGGGVVSNVQHFLSMFVADDQIVGTFLNKSLVADYNRSVKNPSTDVGKIAQWSRGQDEWDGQQIRPLSSVNVPIYHGHVAVLINAGTGSGSEIFAAAAHDFLGSALIGAKSAGAVLVSVMMNATNDFTMEYPIGAYVTARGVRLEGNGLAPQVVVDETKPHLPNTPDEAVDKAVELLAKDKTKDDHGIGVG